jgi:uncharacterized membrane protein YoaK (UPF0700 family)
MPKPDDLDTRDDSARMTKALIWLGMLLGSSAGAALPMAWGDGVLSFSAIALSFVFGVAGAVIGYHVGRSVDG